MTGQSCFGEIGIELERGLEQRFRFDAKLRTDESTAARGSVAICQAELRLAGMLFLTTTILHAFWFGSVERLARAATIRSFLSVDVRDASVRLPSSQQWPFGFRAAATVFDDTLSTTFPDAGHSTGERRFLIIGMSALGRILVVSHIEAADIIRIISARTATR